MNHNRNENMDLLNEIEKYDPYNLIKQTIEFDRVLQHVKEACQYEIISVDMTPYKLLIDRHPSFAWVEKFIIKTINALSFDIVGYLAVMRDGSIDIKMKKRKRKKVNKIVLIGYYPTIEYIKSQTGIS